MNGIKIYEFKPEMIQKNKTVYLKFNIPSYSGSA